MSYVDINADTIDRWVDAGWQWGVPIGHEEYVRAQQGQWDMLLTPTKAVPHHWFGDIAGKKVLGLASGGAQQMPIFAAQGAECTVLDYSPKQLQSERLVAQREGYSIRIVRADMSQPLPFDDQEFDLIFHPVSNCYIRKVKPLWKECYRVLRSGGRLLAGMDHYINYIVDSDETAIVNRLPFDPFEIASSASSWRETTRAYSFRTVSKSRSLGNCKRGLPCWISTKTPTARDGCIRSIFLPL